MESVANIIARYDQAEPEDLKAVRQYVWERYHVVARVAVSGNAIVVTVPSAALANTLRLQATQMHQICQLQKRLIFRIA